MHTIQEAYKDLCNQLKNYPEIQAIGIGDTKNPETSFITIYFKQEPLFKYPENYMGYEVRHVYNAAIIIGDQ